MSQCRNVRIGERGAVLPFVLVTLVLMALVTISLYEQVEAAGRLVLTGDTDLAAERALLSAEEETLYRYLSAQPFAQTLYLGPPLAEDVILTGGASEAEDLPSDQLWTPSDRPQTIDTPDGPVVVVYQDSGAFLNVNLASERQLELFLIEIGVERSLAGNLAARIADYRDDDHIRRFRGAERADYRLQVAPPPRNSPLREVAELADVLGLANELGTDQWRQIEEHASFAAGSASLRRNHVPQRFAALLEERAIGSGMEAFLADDTSLSARARFVLGTPGGRVRAVEFERTAMSPRAPFLHARIYDRQTAEVAR